jgi:hypothetical protein
MASSAKYRTDSCLPRGTGRVLFYVCPSCRGPRATWTGWRCAEPGSPRSLPIQRAVDDLNP